MSLRGLCFHPDPISQESSVTSPSSSRFETDSLKPMLLRLLTGEIMALTLEFSDPIARFCLFVLFVANIYPSHSNGSVLFC